MNLGAWWYAGLVASVTLILTPYVCSKLQERADRLDREAWERIHG